MTATALLRRFEAVGLTLWTEAGRVRYRGPEREIDRVLPELKKHKRELRLAVAIREAVGGVPGISAEQFEALIDDWDREAISDGLIAVETLRAYATSFAKGIAEGRIAELGKVAASAARVRACHGAKSTDQAGDHTPPVTYHLR